MIDHFGINCADWDKSKAFYDKVLGILGYTRQMDYQVAIAGTTCTLRAAGAPEPRFAVGQPVVARIEARACIVVR